jgi:hypothetical protein
MKKSVQNASKNCAGAAIKTAVDLLGQTKGKYFEALTLCIL